MNLQEQIYRINQMMGLLNEDRRTNIFLEYLDKTIMDFYSGLQIEETNLGKHFWDKDAYTQVFYLKDSGLLWFIDCDLWHEIEPVTKMLGYTSYDELVHLMKIYMYDNFDVIVKSVGVKDCD